MADLVLSASSVDTFRRCGYRWYLQYIERHEGTQNVRAAVGLAIHKGAEAYYLRKLAGASHEELMEDAYAELLAEHDAMLVDELFDVEFPDEPIDKAIVQSRRTLRAYLEDVAVDIQPVIEPELAIEATINGIPYSGHLDVADEDVHDIKIKVAKPRFTDDYVFQQVGYGILYRVATGRKERDVVLDFMIRLKRDRPYHMPISNGGPVDDQDIGMFAGILTWAANSIAKSQFEPKGIENGACRWCPVTAYCQPYQETFNATSISEEDRDSVAEWS